MSETWQPLRCTGAFHLTILGGEFVTNFVVLTTLLMEEMECLKVYCVVR